MNRTGARLCHAYILAAVVLCSACDKAGQEIGKTTVKEQKPAAQKVANLDDWLAAVAATHVKVNVRSGDDGVTEYLACFDKERAPDCDLRLSARVDAFRRLHFFDAPLAAWNASDPEKSGMRAYLSVPDCEVPKVFFAPVFRARNSWLFINRVSIMADGKIVLDRDFANNKVDREVVYQRLTETVQLLLDSNEINAIRGMPDAADVTIRLTGEKGYITLDKKVAKDFARDLKRLFVGLDTLSKVTEDLGPISCEKAISAKTAGG